MSCSVQQGAYYEPTTFSVLPPRRQAEAGQPPDRLLPTGQGENAPVRRPGRQATSFPCRLEHLPETWLRRTLREPFGSLTSIALENAPTTSMSPGASGTSRPT